ncbi:phage head closure protein [Amorphus sp. MBR-141]
MSGDLPIGALDRRVRIEAPLRTGDGAGGATVSWATVATVWANVEAVSAVERDRSGRLGGVATHRVTIRARDGVASGQRLVLGGRVLAVRATRPAGRGDRFLVLDAEEEGR